MVPPKKPRFWRICRIYFRRVRITFWLLVLALLGALIYINQIGLPGFIKKPLLEKLRVAGIDLQFTRLRVRWDEGIVAENVRFGRADQPFGPRLTAADVQIQVNHRALAHFRLQVDSLRLRKGRLAWPVAGTNQAVRELALENIKTDLRLLPDDEWALDHFTAAFAGAAIQLSGAITNASSVREWKMFQATGPPQPGLWEARLREFADTLEGIHFSAAPELKVDVRGDGRDPRSFHIRVIGDAPGADTPWGTVTGGKFVARLIPDASNEISRAELQLEADEARTRWASTTNLQFTLQVSSASDETNVIRASLSLSSDGVSSPWGDAGRAQVLAEWVHALTNPIPLSGQCEIDLEDLQHQEWGSAHEVQLAARFEGRDDTALPADESWGFWAKLQPYAGDWQCQVEDLRSPRLQADQLTCRGKWLAPTLAITNLEASLYDGKLDYRAELDVSTRRVRASLETDIDPHKISHLLTQGVRHFLEDYTWEQPPKIEAEVGLVLPAWTNRHPDWGAEVLPTINLCGHFNIAHGGSCRGVPVLTAESHFSYSNLVWRLPDMVATRPEGRITGEHEADDGTHDFLFRLVSTIDVLAARRLLPTNQQPILDLFSFSQPPAIQAEVRGSWNDDSRLMITGRVTMTNFSFRGEHIDDVQTSLFYSNRMLTFTSAHLAAGSQWATADGITVDFEAGKLYLTNGLGSVDPKLITHAIGSDVEKVMEPYHFLLPPTARVHGTIPLKHEEDADLYFEIQGGPFEWWKFKLPHIAGNIHWVGQTVILSDMRADFYGGQAMGTAMFNFAAPGGGMYQFGMSTTNTVLPALMLDLTGRTNNPEGLLSGKLVVTRASLSDSHKVDGFGEMSLRDGLIWSIPIFGVFSPALDSLIPGLGSSRANSAAGTFGITNGILRTDNLEIRSSAMRLQYKGTVDLDGRVNARVEAVLLKDMWGVGPLLSYVLWPITKMFEYKVTGTLAQPKLEPLYLFPKLVLMPFHPFKTLKELMPSDNNSTTNAQPNSATQTNAPPSSKVNGE
jgi:hypothetical protein